MKILLLAGGPSGEAEVSMKSGDNVEQALVMGGYEVVRADPADSQFGLEEAVKGIDVVFPILHGEGGEDGVLQEELEKLDVPFLGSGSTASELAFNKVAFKKLLNQRDILTAPWQEVTGQSIVEAPIAKQPFVLKPIDGGSSIDTFIVRQPTGDFLEYDDAFGRYHSMLLEQLIEGQEITVGVLDSEALPVILIKPPKGKEFDYENKYNGASQEIVDPETISDEVKTAAQKLAVQIHQLVGCRHFSRTDIIITSDNQLYVLEINTIPGMTKESLFPKAAAKTGLDMAALSKRLVELSIG